MKPANSLKQPVLKATKVLTPGGEPERQPDPVEIHHVDRTAANVETLTPLSEQERQAVRDRLVYGGLVPIQHDILPRSEAYKSVPRVGYAGTGSPALRPLSSEEREAINGLKGIRKPDNLITGRPVFDPEAKPETVKKAKSKASFSNVIFGPATVPGTVR